MAIHFGRQVYMVPVACAHFKASLENNQAHSSTLFHHVNDGQRDFRFQRHIHTLYCHIASFRKEFCSSQGRAHLKACEATSASSRFASIQQQSANALPCPVRMNKESSDFSGVVLRIKHVILAISPAVTAIKR